jgi:putative DNA primase/helicase
LIGASGELAISLGILPWELGSAIAAAEKCFQAWIEARGGSGAAEERDGIAAVRAFLSAHIFSRFLPAWESFEFEPKIPNLAGYRKCVDGDPDCWDFFITAEAWAEVAAGFNKTALASTLIKQGFFDSEGRSAPPKSDENPKMRQPSRLSHSSFDFWGVTQMRDLKEALFLFF